MNPRHCRRASSITLGGLVMLAALLPVGAAARTAVPRTQRVATSCVVCDLEVDGSLATSARQPQGYGPGRLTHLYHLAATSQTGRHPTVAVLGAGVDPDLAADLATYRGHYGLRSCDEKSGCLRLIDFRGGPQPAPSDANPFVVEQLGAETMLDLDMVSAACPQCRLMDVSVPWQDGEDDNDVSTRDFARAADTAVADGATIVSVSYGYSSDVNDVAGLRARAFAHRGVEVAAASGDDGYTGAAHASWPADLPSVTAVGGVSLYSHRPPAAWADAGSGCELTVPAASGQPDRIARACAGSRAVSDISADADPLTGVAVYDSYSPSSGAAPGWYQIGGTSAAAPYIAGLYGRANELTDDNGPNTVYAARSTSFTDVTSGATISATACASTPQVAARLCRARSGWDGPTGRGIPHGLGAFRPRPANRTETQR